MASMRFASLRDRLVALIVLAALPTLGLALYVACRYGGEEFVLILPAASLADAQRRAEAIRGLRVTHGARPLEAVRCSMGVAAFPEHGEDGGALLRAADAALYRAKREGRDQVILAD
jgi:diguanylate cyclase (GGDEF)-like protein